MEVLLRLLARAPRHRHLHDDESRRVVQLRPFGVVLLLGERVLHWPRAADGRDRFGSRRLERPLELLVVLAHRAHLLDQRICEVRQLLQPYVGTVDLILRYREIDRAHLPQGAPPFQLWYPRIRDLPAQTSCETAVSVRYRDGGEDDEGGFGGARLRDIRRRRAAAGAARDGHR